MGVFQKAEKSKSKLRAAFFGPSGAGKTYSALAIASGMGKKIALMDSEHGSAAKYSDRFDFDVVDLETKNIAEYVQMINAAQEEGYEVLIIDSMSHAWYELLDDVNKIANARYRGNTWAAWNEGTPKQRKLIEALLNFDGHIIATMRSKTEWVSNKSSDGKTSPTRVGLSPEQGKGIEYEFDFLGELSPDHVLNVIKDRTSKFQDKLIENPGKKFGEELVAWLNEGKDTTDYRKKLSETMKAKFPEWTPKEVGEVVKKIASGMKKKSITDEVAKEILEAINSKSVDPVTVFYGLYEKSKQVEEFVDSMGGEIIEEKATDGEFGEFLDDLDQPEGAVQ